MYNFLRSHEVDINLEVKGCKSVEDSLWRYISEEELLGQNQYYTEEYGKQDAKKYCRFVTVPKVLVLHMKRFEYKVDKTIKVFYQFFY